jgi:predicted DsbA family dithiol-disulfide isomerase
MQQQVTDLAAAEGLTWDHSNSPYVNTVDAHRLLHLALSEYGPQTQVALKESLLYAYFGKAQNVADHALLTELAVAQGMDAARVDQVLESDEFEDAVAADQQQAVAFGANGVPFFVIDRKYGISGAQPKDVFLQALTRAHADA